MADAFNYDDLFKSDIAKSNDHIDCPHCSEPIAKSWIMNVVSTGGKSKATVVDANVAAGTAAGSHSTELADVVPPETGATGQPVAYPGVYGNGIKRGPLGGVNKGFSTHLQFVDTGEDAALADMIAQGRLGHQADQRPIDGGTSSTRNIDIGGSAFAKR